MDFSQRTRQDFLAFDARREFVMNPTQEEIKQSEREEFDKKKNIVRDILASFSIVLDEAMGGQSNWIHKYTEYLNTDRVFFQKKLGSDKVYANLEKIILDRTTEYSKDQLKGFVDFVYDLSYNPILDN